ncbi:cbb3-type cytochrome c oxidase subunit 3 [Mariprofundus ferrooxydans]|nr:cbb3-type cytochrome c oxidase subunit 3 [Mariprofundus ferrooxydans]
MSSLREYFSTDWAAMTHADWSGLVIVLVLTALMIGIYIWTFSPKNRDKFEQHRDFVNEHHDEHHDEHHKDTHREVEHGQAK